MRTVADELLATLERAGVRHIFGVPGTTETPLLDALVDAPGIEYVLCLHEAVAVAMADGYARASGMPAVANVHTSVGTANSLSMLHVCWQDSSPVLVLAGHKDSRILGTAAYCEEPQDIVQMPAQFTRWSWSPRRAEQVIPAVERALKETVASPPRPSFLAISEDLLAALREPAPARPAPGTFRVTAQGGGQTEALETIADRIAAASRPVLVMGSAIGRSDAMDAAVELADAVAGPVLADDIRCLDALPFPTDHHLYAGFFDPRSEVVRQADLLVAVGATLFRRTAYLGEEWLSPDVPLVQIHPDDREIARVHPVVVGLVGDLRSNITGLSARLSARSQAGQSRGSLDAWVRSAVEDERRQREKELQEVWDEEPIHVARLAHELQHHAGPHAIVVDEAVTSRSTFLQHHRFRPGCGYFASGVSALGWGAPAALGVKLAQPDRPVFAVLGDGAFLFSQQALWTAANKRIPVVFLVLNNRGYNAVRDGLIAYGKRAAEVGTYPATAITEPAIDFGNLAASYGVLHARVSDPAQLGEAIRRAEGSDHPLLVEVMLA